MTTFGKMQVSLQWCSWFTSFCLWRNWDAQTYYITWVWVVLYLYSFVLRGVINKILNCRDLSGDSAKPYLPPPMEYWPNPIALNSSDWGHFQRHEYVQITQHGAVTINTENQRVSKVQNVTLTGKRSIYSINDSERVRD